MTIASNATASASNADSQDLAPASTQPEASQTDYKVEDPIRLERRITLAGENDVEGGPISTAHWLNYNALLADVLPTRAKVVKGQYSRLSCVHIYSISAAPIKVGGVQGLSNSVMVADGISRVLKDSVALTAPMERVRAIDGERGVDHARKVGMTVVPNAKVCPSNLLVPKKAHSSLTWLLFGLEVVEIYGKGPNCNKGQGRKAIYNHYLLQTARTRASSSREEEIRSSRME